MTNPTAHTETRNPNGTTTYRLPAVRDWWTTQQCELERMKELYHDQGNWEDRGDK